MSLAGTPDSADQAPPSSLPADALGSAAQRDRRRRILTATIELARKGGFDAVQMRAVADRADVALGTLYRYFPSKIHLLVSALSRQFEDLQAGLDKRPVEGEDAAARVINVLQLASGALQRDRHLTEALTRAFMFADASVAPEIHVVGLQMTTLLNKAMQGEDYVAGHEPTETEIAVARVISDVWLAALVSWTTGRASADEVAEHVRTAVRMLLR